MDETPSQKYNRLADARGREQAHELSKYDEITRQRTRRTTFEAVMEDVNRKHGGDPRSVRRAVARTIAKRVRSSEASA
jgi:hypothetical protein